MKNFSVVIVTYKRPELLERCLSSVRHSKLPPLDIIVVVNGDDAESSCFIQQNFHEVFLKNVQKTTPGEARNLGVTHARGEYILFLDDDAEISESYTQKALDFARANPEAAIFGGPDSTAQNASLYEQSVGQTLKSPFASGHTRFRHKQTSSKCPVPCDDSRLILCAMWFKRKLFTEENMKFDLRFFRNEENVFIQQALTRKFEVWYVPTLWVVHRRRNNPVDLCRAIIGSGYFRAKSAFYFPNTFSLLFLTPLFFLIYLFTLPWSYKSGGHVLLALYLPAIGIASLWHSTKKLSIFIFNIFNHILFNVAYGSGILFYLLQFPINRSIPQKGIRQNASKIITKDIFDF